MTRLLPLIALATMALSSTATSTASTKPQRPPVYVPVCHQNPWKCGTAPVRVKVVVGPRK